MAVKRVYNGTPNGASITNTESIKGAIALYMIAPDISDEIEIDFYLQLEISATDNRLVRLNENFTLDTVVIYPIPLEFQFTDLNIYGAFTSSLGQNVEIWAIVPENSLADLPDQIEETLKLQRADLAIEVAQAVNAIQQSITLGAIGASLAPLTLGGSALTLPALAGATAGLTTAINTAQLLLLP
ncbi:hypothetical protein VKI22_10505 [Cyanobacterium aponinum UTEX 3221]|uniref:hypothetical protein n=1 Tax=Cyanobacterium aponinum TaxID=379064 RepID=UPI002B4BBDF9|nr:hypothetical protein [Cyanobacterium aponinum]WRL37061.1 hypothetical protein VKI22_10505 [Cyanobacterium aponinum UTEX 3221]